MVRRELEYFFGALRFFTRLPVPAWVGHSTEGLNRASRYFSAVGLVVGALAALVFCLARLGWPTELAVLASMGASLWATGAFHEDGLSDMTDGFGGGWTKEKVLTIMKDSRVGNYGVVVLWCVLTGKFLALLLLAQRAPVVWLVPAVLVAGHSLSRFCSTVLLRLMDYVREDALSKAKPLATRMGNGEMVVSALFALLGLAPLLFLLPPAPALRGCLLAALGTFWVARLMRRRLGGYTGDCLGATQQIAELCFYLGMLWTSI